MPVTSVPAHVFPLIRSPSVAGSGSAAATTSRGATSTPFTRIGSLPSRPSLWSVFSTSMNSSPSPYLNVTRRQSIQRGTSSTSSCSTLTHSTGPIPSGKSNTSGSENGAVVNQPRSRSQIDRRVEALLDRRPDRERRREVVAVDDEVRAVPDPDLVDRREELVGGVPREDVRRTRLDPDPDEREQALLLPRRGAIELVVAELDARQLVRPLGVRLGERHRHVEVRDARLEARVEDRHVEDRVDAVQHRVGPRLADQPRATPSVLEASIRCALNRPSSSSLDERLRAGGVVVGERAVIEERRRRAMPANAEPTPPVPTTRILTARVLPATVGRGVPRNAC